MSQILLYLSEDAYRIAQCPTLPGPLPARAGTR